jgi:hypothetical protein
MNAAQTTLFLPVTRSMRKRLESAIESLVALLDEIDGDPDREDDEHELDQVEDGVADSAALEIIEHALHPESRQGAWR